MMQGHADSQDVVPNHALGFEARQIPGLFLRAVSMQTLPSAPGQFGLVFGKADLKRIDEYVSTGLNLPGTRDGVIALLELKPVEMRFIPVDRFLLLFFAVKTHCSGWGAIERDIRNEAKIAQIFAGSFIQTADDALGIIDAMPIRERVGRLADAAFLREEATHILSGLRRLRQDAVDRGKAANRLQGSLRAFCRRMENEVKPKIDELVRQLGAHDLISGADYLKKVLGTPDRKEISAQGSSSLEALLMLIMRSVPGLEKAAIVRNAIQASPLFTEGVVAVQHLEVFWSNTVQHIDSSIRDVEDLREGSSLTVFRNRLSTSLAAWREVGAMMGELS